MTASPKPNPTANTAPNRPAPPAGPLLSELFGMADARAWGEALVRAMADYRAGRIKWADVDPGCVLHGPPGTGKTTYAKALAASAKLPLITATFGEWQGADEGHLGTLIRAMHDSFNAAKAARPCIFFIDELDSIPARANNARSATYWNQFTNSLLKALDDLAQTQGVVVIGACNHPDMLDPAIVRSGRMDGKIAITLPSVDDIQKIIRFHLTPNERTALSASVTAASLRPIALFCAGMSGADIASAVRNARSQARVKQRPLTPADFFEVLDPASKRADPQTQWRVAVHEAGHAVAAYRLIAGCQINLSIVPNENNLGGVRLAGRSQPITKTFVENQLVFLLAGRAAEEVFLDEVSAGAGGGATSDLGQATNLAIDAATKLGLSGRDSLRWLGHPERLPLPQYPADVIEEVTNILSETYESAVTLIEDEWDFVNNVALALVKRRALSHAEFTVIDRRPKGTHPRFPRPIDDIFDQVVERFKRRKA